MDPVEPISGTPGSERRPVSLNPLGGLRSRVSGVPAGLRRLQVGEAFWRVSAVFSLGVNLILVAVVLLLAANLFSLKQDLLEPLISDLHTSFVQMDTAHIRTTITVSEKVPVSFTLPVKETTTVTLSEPVRIEGATVTIRSGVLAITNAPTTVTLPVGTRLPIELDFEVPVDTTIPIEIRVPVDIPLEETELHGPFARLRDAVGPYRELLDGLPDCWAMALWGGVCR